MAFGPVTFTIVTFTKPAPVSAEFHIFRGVFYNWRFGCSSEEHAVGTGVFESGCVRDLKAGLLPFPVEHFN